MDFPYLRERNKQRNMNVLDLILDIYISPDALKSLFVLKN